MTTILSSDAIPILEINHSIRFKNVRYYIPNLCCFMFKRLNELRMGDVTEAVPFKFCQDPVTHLAALCLRDHPKFVVTVEMILNEVVRKMKKWLKSKHKTYIEKVLVQVPSHFQDYQRELLIHTLENAGLSSISLDEE
ncbi:MAG: hypothetical protein Ta2E_12260 [Mycoplasmoidaceae bacterium]|nr:MAG: hypothetical protein Ta2E_12260 [Mycoplasmoidaceae bacterium]